MKKNLFAKLAVIAGTVAASASAFAVDPATGLEAIGTVATGAAGYGPPMFGLAVIAVGVMVGVKWIKRARGAA